MLPLQAFVMLLLNRVQQPGTLRRLAESWLESKTFLEERFFQTRIPIRGGW